MIYDTLKLSNGNHIGADGTAYGYSRRKDRRSDAFNLIGTSGIMIAAAELVLKAK